MSDETSGGSPPAQPPIGTTAALPSKFDDPCKAYKELNERRRELISGEGLSEFEYHGNGTERRLKYNIANLAALDRDIREAQAECAKSIGVANPGRRFALEARHREDGIPAARWSARLGYY